MRAPIEIEQMLARFDAEGEDCDGETEAVRNTLIWVLGGMSDDSVTQYLST